MSRKIEIQLGDEVADRLTNFVGIGHGFRCGVWWWRVMVGLIFN